MVWVWLWNRCYISHTIFTSFERSKIFEYLYMYIVVFFLETPYEPIALDMET